MTLSDFEKGLVVAFKECGWTFGQISSRIGHPQSTLKSFMQRFKKTGEYKRKEGSGRPKILSERAERRVVLQIKRQSKSSAKSVKNHLDLAASTQTVRRLFKKNGFVSRIQAKKPFLRKNNIKARLEWAKVHVGLLTGEKWSGVMNQSFVSDFPQRFGFGESQVSDICQRIAEEQ